jgi:hypothetical protein
LDETNTGPRVKPLGWLQRLWSSAVAWPYSALLLFFLLLIPIYVWIVPCHYYSDRNNIRAFAIAFLSGSLVGATEIVSRYRDEQMKAVLSPDGLLYVVFNGAISTFALVLIFHYESSVAAFSMFKDSSLGAAVAAGFGSTAIMRTRLAVIKGTDNKDLSIGPDIVINLLLSMIDRRIDRWRAARRQEIIARCFSDLRSLGSIDQASQYLLSTLLAFQNLSDSDKQQLAERVQQNKQSTGDVNIQFQALGFAFLTVLGEENFASALQKARQIQSTTPLSNSPLSAPPTAPPPVPSVTPPPAPPIVTPPVPTPPVPPLPPGSG